VTSIDRSDRDRSLAAAVPETDGSEPAPLEPAGATRGRWLSRRTWLAAIAGVLVLPIVVAAGLTFSATGSDVQTINAAAARVVSASDMEQEYGIKVTLVAVIAAGGLVDVRFTVVDKDKATHFLHDATTLPALYVESSGAVLTTSRAKAHKMTVLDGGSYFVLYPNSGGAIQAGTGVSVVVDGLRLEPITAQS
jgi:hypothetical protein